MSPTAFAALPRLMSSRGSLGASARPSSKAAAAAAGRDAASKAAPSA
eukprot:CAMPEP_0119381166 /NCGR_PEP_ID=MMETSP1334-20130426/61613_1 /TAXON_ID=127549 /ORGANISM="Calcidiscus leptoporus, Strain RCC1130" /LENGTH=46 /DNA_ID= /DNA_START= /DNA_END= /DNA_ORIENTATION=